MPGAKGSRANATGTTKRAINPHWSARCALAPTRPKGPPRTKAATNQYELLAHASASKHPEDRPQAIVRSQGENVRHDSGGNRLDWTADERSGPDPRPCPY
jgi:hypothetical protein